MVLPQYNRTASIEVFVSGDIVVVIDKDDDQLSPSVSNDIYTVVKRVYETVSEASGKVIIYRDSMGVFDLVLHANASLDIELRSLGGMAGVGAIYDYQFAVDTAKALKEKHHI